MTPTLKTIRENYKTWHGNSLREAGDKVNFIETAVSRSQVQRAKEKWGKYDTTTDNQKKIIEAARKGDKDAIVYTYIKCADNIGKTFWKSYLGPSGKARQKRIDEGAITEWTALAWETLVGGHKGYRDAKGALETFDTSKYDHGDLFKNFGYHYWRLLQNTANEDNYVSSTGGMADTPGIKGGKWTGKRDGITSYDPTYMDSEQEKNDTRDPTLEEFEGREEIADFIRGWKEFAQDPIVNESHYGITPGGILRIIIENTRNSDGEGGYNQVLKAYGGKVSKNTIRGYVSKVVEVFPKYDLDYPMLQNAIRVLGEDKVASYLPNDLDSASQVGDDVPAKDEEAPVSPPADVETPMKAEKQAKVARSAPRGDYKDKCDKLSEDPHLWTSARKGWTAGAFLFEMIKDPSVKPSTFSEWNAIPGDWNTVTYNRTLKLVKKYGLDWEMLKKLPQDERESLASMIGEES